MRERECVWSARESIKRERLRVRERERESERFSSSRRRPDFISDHTRKTPTFMMSALAGIDLFFTQHTQPSMTQIKASKVA